MKSQRIKTELRIPAKMWRDMKKLLSKSRTRMSQNDFILLGLQKQIEIAKLSEEFI